MFSTKYERRNEDLAISDLVVRFEMAPGKRHFPRNSIHPNRVWSPTSNASVGDEPHKLRKVCSTCINEGLYDILPIHLPVPMLPCENHLGTELFLVFFSIACGFMQYYNIYQNAWWLPHSYTHYGVNLHLIDWFVVQFILMMAVRPLLFTVVRGYLIMIMNRFESKRSLNRFIRLTMLILVTSYGGGCGFFFWWTYGFIMMLIMYLPKNIKDFYDSSIASLPTAGFIKGTLLHRCNVSSQRSRDEVHFLRSDFNARVKCLLFNSFTNAYYCVYIPACYSQGFLYFEDTWVSYYIVLVWLTCICIYIPRYFPFDYYDACHRAALHLGSWSKLNGKFGPCYAWTDSIFWYKGLIVKHNGLLYRADCLKNSAEPGNTIHEHFYGCFAKPGFLMYCWVAVEVGVVCLQFVFLLFSTQWNHVLASCIMLSCTYSSLYKCFKNFNLFDTLYKLEDSVQAKMITAREC